MKSKKRQSSRKNNRNQRLMTLSRNHLKAVKMMNQIYKRKSKRSLSRSRNNWSKKNHVQSIEHHLRSQNNSSNHKSFNQMTRVSQMTIKRKLKRKSREIVFYKTRLIMVLLTKRHPNLLQDKKGIHPIHRIRILRNRVKKQNILKRMSVYLNKTKKLNNLAMGLQ